MEIKLDCSKLEFKVNKQKLFQNLFDFNLGSVLTELIDVDSTKEASAFAMLFNVTRKTNVLLARELDQATINNTYDLVTIFADVEAEWTQYFNENVVLTKDFFGNIIQFNPNYLIKSYNLFTSYMNRLQIEIPTDYYYKYYSEFRSHLLNEYNEISEKYKKLADFFNNPILDANDSFARQIEHYIEIGKNYTTKLQSGVDESNETLKDLYVAPYFKIHRKNLIKGEQKDFLNPETKIDINSFLNHFVLENNLPKNLRDNYNMIFILGQPGQGKTSLCYKLIFDILAKTNGLPDTPLFFIKIRDLHAKDFVNDTFETLKKAIQQNVNFERDKCLLVLDGLDEAYMSGGLTDSDLKNLYERLNKTSKQNKNLKIILTSRLNYLKIDDPSIEGSLVVQIDVLEKEQIKEYLRRFALFYPDNILVKQIDDILSQDRYEHVEELLEQPVLMYFIALSNISIEEDDSKAKIYNKIFDSLARRSWDKNGQLNYIKPELLSDHKKYSKYLRQYIRSLAFEIYQSPNLHITLSKLISLDSTKEFIKKCLNDSISSDSDAIKDVSKYLLVSFYFQTATNSSDGDAAIEFFHNSLWEYLTAEFMWEENKQIIQKTDTDGDLIPVRIEEYFDVLKNLVGNKSFKIEVRRNLENIISIESPELKEKLFNQSNDIFFKLVEKDMLLFYDSKTEKLSAKEKMQNIFELAWTFLYWNSNLKLRIVTTAKCEDFFFDIASNFYYDYNLKNIDFNGDCFTERYITDCVVEYVNFNDNLFMGPLNLNSNSFINTNFNNYNLERIRNNTFNNITFNKIMFSGEFSVYNNNFKNVRIIQARVPDQSWLKKIIDNNVVDEQFIKEHKIVKKTEKNQNDEKITNYFITSKRTD